MKSEFHNQQIVSTKLFPLICNEFNDDFSFEMRQTADSTYFGEASIRDMSIMSKEEIAMVTPAKCSISGTADTKIMQSAATAMAESTTSFISSKANHKANTS